MNPAISTALSGMNAYAKRLEVSANNIANVRTSGKLEAAEGSANAAFTPQQVVQESVPGGGVKANVVATDPATYPAFNSGDANADADGMVAMPNVSMEQEMVEQKMAVIGYKANAEVVRTAVAMDKSLFDIKA